jgi:signal peptidase I
MLGGYESYSLRRKSRLKPVLRVVALAALVIALHSLITRVAVFSVRVDSVSMQPALQRGDRLLATPLAFGIPIGLLPGRLRSYGVPHRGDLVVFELPGSSGRTWIADAGETVLRFFTLNNRSIDEGPDRRPVARFQIKRVIGLPGDTVRLESLLAYVRPAGHAGFQPEQEVAPRSYAVEARRAVDWPAGLPFGGDTGEITLKDGEYFLLGDNRAHSSDSRSWGPVPRSLIRGRTLVRYWPVTRLGRP